MGGGDPGQRLSADPQEKPASGAPEVITSSGVRFKVQIATSSKRVDTAPRNFKGLEGVEEQRGAGLYRYLVGNEATLEDARDRQQKCRELGFEGAFIVAFKDGERIDLQEAVKLARVH